MLTERTIDTEKYRLPHAGDRALIVDIGSSNVNCLAAQFVQMPGFGLGADVTGAGQSAMAGVAQGELPDLASAAPVGAAMHRAAGTERLAGHRIYVAVPVNFLTRTRIAIEMEIGGREVLSEDIEDCLEAARQDGTPDRHRVLHLERTDHAVDGIGGFADPLGMQCQTLKITVTLYTAPVAVLNHLRALAGNEEGRFGGFVTAPQAVAASVLQEEEKKLGVLTIDFGGRRTGYSVHRNGRLTAIGHVSVGGMGVTRDLSLALGTGLQSAEHLKIRHGTCFCAPGDEGKLVALPGHPGDTVSVLELAEIIGPRIEEILTLIREDAARQGVNLKALRRVVVTGGGAQLHGLADLIRQLMDMHVRLGEPLEAFNAPVEASGCAYAVANGMIAHLLVGRKNAGNGENLPAGLHVAAGGVLGRTVTWLKECL